MKSRFVWSVKIPPVKGGKEQHSWHTVMGMPGHGHGIFRTDRKVEAQMHAEAVGGKVERVKVYS